MNLSLQFILFISTSHHFQCFSHSARVLQKKREEKKHKISPFESALITNCFTIVKNAYLLRKHDKDQPKQPNLLSPGLTCSSTGGGRDYKSNWCQQRVKQTENQSAFREAERIGGLAVHLDRSLEEGKISTVDGQRSQNLRWDLCLTMYL